MEIMGLDFGRFLLQAGFVVLIVYTTLFTWSVWNDDPFLEHSIQTRFSILFPPHEELSIETKNANNKKLHDLMNTACMLLSTIMPLLLVTGYDNHRDFLFKMFTLSYWAHTVFNLKKTSIQKSIYGLIALYGSCLYLI